MTAALSGVPGVLGVALGGSQARGAQRPDSDWDLAVYYRDALDVEQIRAIGWPGDLTGLGGWGSLFNGGGKVTVDGRAVDLHYRDLAEIERIHADAEQGRFYIDGLLFHQAGIPSYILLAELGINRPLWGRGAAVGVSRSAAKGLLAQAGVDGVDDLVLEMSAEPDDLVRSVSATRDLLWRLTEEARRAPH